MKKEVISDREGIALVVLFIIGESSILISGLSAKNDMWIAIILSMLAILPFMFLYGNLFNTFQNKDLLETIELVFGKFIGKAVILLYTWYAFDLAALVLRDFGNFVVTVTLPDTPIIVPLIGIMILCAWIVKEGIEVMSRWAYFFLFLPGFLSFIAVLFLIPQMDLNNLRPILHNGMKPVTKGAYEVFIYPFGETVIFTIVFSSLISKRSIYKIYTRGLLIGGFFLLMTSLTIVLVLGIHSASNIYFPGYSAASRIHVGELLHGVEVISAISFLLGGFTKTCVYLLAACKGIVTIFGYKNYRFIVIPISLLVVNLAYFEFDSIISYNAWIFDVWIYSAFLFIVILPVIIFVITKIRKKKLEDL